MWSSVPILVFKIWQKMWNFENWAKKTSNFNIFGFLYLSPLCCRDNSKCCKINFFVGYDNSKTVFKSFVCWKLSRQFTILVRHFMHFRPFFGFRPLSDIFQAFEKGINSCPNLMKFKLDLGNSHKMAVCKFHKVRMKNKKFEYFFGFSSRYLFFMYKFLV